MGIPARYCTGYMGDIGIPPDPEPMDFSGWYQVYLSGQWYTFDARHNHPRIGRILMATGRDAADVALTTSFGRMELKKFVVISDEVVAADSCRTFVAYAPRKKRLIGWASGDLRDWL